MKKLIFIILTLILAIIISGTTAAASDSTTINVTVQQNINNSSYTASNESVTFEGVSDLQEGLDCNNLDITTGGSQNSWSLMANSDSPKYCHDKIDCVCSGETGNNGNSWLHTYVSTPGWISFWWRVSSSPGDKLIFTDDGVNAVPSISGDVGWTHISYYVKEPSNLDWSYQKDSNPDWAGLDEGAIDQMTWTPGKAAVYQLIEGSQFQKNSLTSMPSIGDPKLCVVLVDFKDYQHSNAMTTNVVYNKFFGNGDPADSPFDSVRNFYLRSSYGKLNLTGDVLPWYTANGNRADYEYTYTYTDEKGNPKIDKNGNPITEQFIKDSFLKEVFDYYISKGYDFSKYDNPNYGNPPDGFVDGLYLIVTGPPTTPWWYINRSCGCGYLTYTNAQGVTYTINGFSDGAYSAFGTNQFGATEVSYWCHETGHKLGLDDVYTHEPGFMDLMDGNNCDINIFSKMYLGWIQPTIATSGSRTITLRPSEEYPDAVLISDHYIGNIWDEYYLIQYRKKIGNDINLPGSGLLIWHILMTLDPNTGWGVAGMKGTKYETCNAIRLMEADGIYTKFLPVDAGDFYTPGKSFGYNTTPDSSWYYQIPNGINVSNIVYNSGSDSYSANFAIDPPIVTADIKSGTYPRFFSLNLTKNFGGTIYYTLDGSDPTKNGIKYTGTLTIGDSIKPGEQGAVILKFCGLMNPFPIYSDIFQEVYTFDRIKPTASANPVGGTYNKDQNVTIKGTDNLDINPTIYYTLDGSTPTVTPSEKYTGPITLSSDATLNYIAVDKVGNLSKIYTEKYTIDKGIPKITVTPPGGWIIKGQNVPFNIALQMDKSGTIYYSTKANTSIYSPITIKADANKLYFIKISTDTTLRVWGISDLGTKSIDYKYEFKFDMTNPNVSANISGGTYSTAQNIILTASDNLDPNPVIYYTLDGNPPSPYNTYTSIYTTPILLNSNTTLKFSTRDAAGNWSDMITNNYIINKTPQNDTTPPTITSTDPAKDATGVSLTSPITITFSENITSGTNYSGIYIKNTASGATVSIASKNITGNTLTITQTNARKTKTQYKVYIPASAVKDSAGNNLKTEYTYNFTTTGGGTGDTTPPTVTNTDPAKDATGVSLTSPITITFSENITSGTNYSGIYIKNTASGATVSIASKNITGNTLTIKQTNPRKNKTLYKVYIPASAVKDSAGNNLKTDYTYNFTTA